jgi:hypothetical protein
MDAARPTCERSVGGIARSSACLSYQRGPRVYEFLACQSDRIAGDGHTPYRQRKLAAPELAGERQDSKHRALPLRPAARCLTEGAWAVCGSESRLRRACWPAPRRLPPPRRPRGCWCPRSPRAGPGPQPGRSSTSRSARSGPSGLSGVRSTARQSAVRSGWRGGQRGVDDSDADGQFQAQEAQLPDPPAGHQGSLPHRQGPVKCPGQASGAVAQHLGRADADLFRVLPAWWQKGPGPGESSQEPARRPVTSQMPEANRHPAAGAGLPDGAGLHPAPSCLRLIRRCHRTVHSNPSPTSCVIWSRTVASEPVLATAASVSCPGRR